MNVDQSSGHLYAVDLDAQHGYLVLARDPDHVIKLIADLLRGENYKPTDAGRRLGMFMDLPEVDTSRLLAREPTDSERASFEQRNREMGGENPKSELSLAMLPFRRKSAKPA